MKKVCITGGNRGIGLAMAAEFLRSGDSVMATVRPGSERKKLEVLQLSYASRLIILENGLANEADWETLGEAVADGLDVLVNNAGTMAHDETIAEVTLDQILSNFTVNAAVPLMVTQQCLPGLRKAEGAKIINVSSSFASISIKSEKMPTRYSYSLSKAALNMLTKTLAGEVGQDGMIAASIHPGWVRTGIGGPNAALSPEESARGMVETINGLTADQNGAYLTWDGRALDW